MLGTLHEDLSTFPIFDCGMCSTTIVQKELVNNKIDINVVCATKLCCTPMVCFVNNSTYSCFLCFASLCIRFLHSLI